MDDRMLAAATNNAAWCDLVCRAYGVPTSFTDDLWWASGPTPPFYPDAVTLRSAARAEVVAARLADRPDASVKDSFASLDDLGRFGFAPLFDATWVHRRPDSAPESPVSWTVIASPESLARWQTAAVDVTPLPAVVLEDRDVCLLALSDGADGIGGGAILNHGGSVVGVSNVFSVTMAADGLWRGVVAAAADLFPARPLVGYEQGPDLEPALAAGFTELGPLRIWARPS